LLSKLTTEKKFEIAFLSSFSILIIGLFYALVSMNGLILGNDPAAHLAKAQIFLETGHIPLGNNGWIPPLFEILLALAISLSGASNVGQMIFLEKALAVTVDWLLFLSVYLVGSKFFNKKVGAVAAVFLSMCYPLYFLNTWGGYTTALGMAFLLLLFCSSYFAVKQPGYIVVTFFVAFAIVLSQQLTAFIAVVIMLPFMVAMIIKFKSGYLKTFTAIIIGGATAFFAFYFPAIINYIDVAPYHMFFGNKAYSVDIPYTNFQSFLVYFGFIQFLAIGGIGISYYLLKQQKKLAVFSILMLAFFVPLFFAESYLFGLSLPFEWFTYYLASPLVILAAVCFIFAAEKLSAYFKNRGRLNKKWLKVASFALMVLVGCPIIGFQVWNTFNAISYDAAFNSVVDLNAYNAAVWLSQDYPGAATVVDTISPGDWFTILSGKNTISQNYDWEGTNSIAQSILTLDYEIQGPQNIVRAYEPNDNVTDENYVSINQIWSRISYSSLANDILSFTQNGVNYSFALSELSRTISVDGNSGIVEFKYFNNQVAVSEAIQMQNDSYPIKVTWSITPLTGEISNVTLFLTTSFDLNFDFYEALIPPFMDWSNPWDMPSKMADGKNWASVDFSSSDMADHYIALYDQEKHTAFAFNFTDLPDWGNIGALADRQIDAVRYQYDFEEIDANQSATRQYQVLTLAKDTFPTLEPNDLKNIFSLKIPQFTISIQDYKEYIAENTVSFIVYDKDQFYIPTSSPLGDSFLPQLSQCQFLKLVYSNNRYDIFKILDNYNQTQVWTQNNGVAS